MKSTTKLFSVLVLGLLFLFFACSENETIPSNNNTGDISECNQKHLPGQLCNQGAKKCHNNQLITCAKVANCFIWSQPEPCPGGTSCQYGECQCKNLCSPAGTKICEGNGYKQCQEDQNGCLIWGQVFNCAQNQVCSGGRCATSCGNVCTPGSFRCSGSAAVQICMTTQNGCNDWGQIKGCEVGKVCKNGQCVCDAQCNLQGTRTCDGDGFKTCVVDHITGCLKWGKVYNCESGAICSGGQCVKHCTNSCTMGETKCQGDGVQECAKQPNGCLDWGPTKKCAQDKVCDKGQCVCDNQCDSEGARSCDGDGFKTCQKASSGCFLWSVATSCPSDQPCSGGKCVAKCSDSCVLNTRKCSGDGFMVCESKTSGCTDWSEIISCEKNKICSQGKCRCDDQCGPEGMKTCDGNGFKSCEKDANGCLHWGQVTYCATDQVCSGGQCQIKCTNVCTEGEKKCSGDGFQECVKKANNCTDWGEVKNCGTNKVCRQGQCTCNDECELVGVKICDGNGYKSCQKDTDGCHSWSGVTQCQGDNVCQKGNCVSASTVQENLQLNEKCGPYIGNCIDTLLCFQVDFNSMSGSCLKKCSPSDSSQQCTNNQTCIAVQGTGGVCYDQNTTIRQEGETCSSFTGNCQSGLVCTYMDVNNRDGFCMNSCDPNTPTCPGGECLKLSNGKGACYKKPANTRQVDEICDPIKGYCASDMICVNLDNNKSGGICSAVCSPDPAGSVSQCGTGKKCFTLSDGRGACLNEPALTKAKGEVCSFNQGYCQGDMLCVNIYASSTEGICLEKCDLQSPQCGTEEQCLELQGGGGACY